MSSGPSYKWSSLTTADMQLCSDLVNLLAKVDDTQEYYTPEDLAEELAFADVDPALDTWAVRTEDGELVAYGQVFFRDALVEGSAASSSSGGVHPDHRRRGLGSELRRRIEQRARDGNARLHPGHAVVLRADVGLQVLDARELLARQGFAESRYFHELRHDLSTSGTDPVATVADRPGEDRPSGDGASAAVRPYRPGDDDDTVLDVHTQAFATQWRSAPWTASEWRDHIIDARSFRPALSFVHVGESGVVDGYVLSSEYVAGEVWVTLLGVLEPARGHGVGSALLQAVLAAAHSKGYRDVGLGLDTEALDSDNSAGGLYASLGFRRVRATVACLKTLSAS